MIYIRRIFKQDLSKGKQIAFPLEPALYFFDFDVKAGSPERIIRFKYRSNEANEFDGRILETRLYISSSESRVDCELQGFLKEVGTEETEFLVLINNPANYMDYTFFIVKKDDDMYETYDQLMNSEGKSNRTTSMPKNHLLVYEASVDEEWYNRIVFGAPGTGKSFKLQKEWGTSCIANADIDEVLIREFQKLDSEDNSLSKYFAMGFKYGDIISKKYNTKEDIKGLWKSDKVSYVLAGALAYKNFYKDVKGRSVERVTFHPNYSYAQFVGSYKPVMIPRSTPSQKTRKKGNDGTAVIPQGTERDISYQYVPGPFMRVFVAAKKHPREDFLLLIEEINRANVAAVFGEVFQLLDRTETGESEYPVIASEDIRQYLADKGIHETEIKIPSNMYIWATMNSADQGVLPMDTAFKRRWEFEYIPIDNGDELVQDYLIPYGDDVDGFKVVRWNALRKRINNVMSKIGINEDKLMGSFFLKMSELDELKDALISCGLKLEEKYKDEDDEDEEGKFKKNIHIYDLKNKIPQERMSEIKKVINTAYSAFCGKVLMYLFEDAVRTSRHKIFKSSVVKQMRFSNICTAFKKNGMSIFGSDE